MHEVLDTFHFLRPWWLLGLIPLLFTLRYLNASDEINRRWQRVIAPHLLRVMVVRGARRRWFNPVRVAPVMMILGFIVIAGPSWERAPTPFFEDTAPLLIALDVSDSMGQHDVQPSRLERAKQKVHDLLELRGDARTALVAYAGSAHTVIPLTPDRDVIEHLLHAVSAEIMPRPGKLPETVLPIADVLLRDTPAGTLLLMGDGVGAGTVADFDAFFHAPEHSMHQLLVLGVGTEREETRVPLERAALRGLASATGGRYESLTYDRSDVRALVSHITAHLVDVQDEQPPWKDAGYYLLFPFAALFLLWFRKGWTLQWSSIVLVIAAAFSPPYARADFADWWLTGDQQGRYHFEQGNYQRAGEAFQDPAWKGFAYYMAGDYEASQAYFGRLNTADGLFNLGTAFARGRRYVDAVDAYDRALALDPDHEPARHNRRLVQALIDEINAMSEAQVSEGDDSSKPLGDEPQTADGAEKTEFGTRDTEQYTAEQVLADKRIQALWLRGVQVDSGQFLSQKFYLQLETQR